jgi:hypothetical protein
MQPERASGDHRVAVVQHGLKLTCAGGTAMLTNWSDDETGRSADAMSSLCSLSSHLPLSVRHAPFEAADRKASRLLLILPLLHAAAVKLRSCR